MINRPIEFTLGPPWNNQTFATEKIGSINYLVGPNGSGKTRFSLDLVQHLRRNSQSIRLLGTDRLNEMSRASAMDSYFGDSFRQGFDRSLFDKLRAAGQQGSGIDTIVHLQERIDLRIQVQATLSHLFDREIDLEWDSGRLIPKAMLRGQNQWYRLDREECHGIKELLVMLTHLYDDKMDFLVIDEPELNLHPQYQAFFMQEVRRVAGDPESDARKKVVFLVTHSPFILDLRSEEDLMSVISFDLDYSEPKQVFNLLPAGFLFADVTRRLNGHNKQFFFSDSPIFVEGIRDAQIVEAIVESRGATVAGAGSCVIASGGNNELTLYLSLCNKLKKQAHFLYDLDSLFDGQLRKRIHDDPFIRTQLAESGHGSDLNDYCGKMEKKLAGLIVCILNASLPDNLFPLEQFLRKLGLDRPKQDKKKLAKGRVSLVTAISRYRNEMIGALSNESVVEIEGYMKEIVAILRAKNIHLLPGGSLERYLPSYQGNEYNPSETSKQTAVDCEIQELSKPMTESELKDRYGDLFEAVCKMPSKTTVDVEPTLHDYLCDYIHNVQRAIIKNPTFDLAQIQAYMQSNDEETATIFSVSHLKRSENNEYEAVVSVAEMIGQPRRIVHVTHYTNAGNGDFKLQTLGDSE